MLVHQRTVAASAGGDVEHDGRLPRQLAAVGAQEGPQPEGRTVSRAGEDDVHRQRSRRLAVQRGDERERDRRSAGTLPRPRGDRRQPGVHAGHGAEQEHDRRHELRHADPPGVHCAARTTVTPSSATIASS